MGSNMFKMSLCLCDSDTRGVQPSERRLPVAPRVAVLRVESVRTAHVRGLRPRPPGGRPQHRAGRPWVQSRAHQRQSQRLLE